MKFSSCTKCGTTEIPHLSKGMCRKCYYKFQENNYKIKKAGISLQLNVLNKDILAKLYFGKRLSLSEIANTFSCSRQYILKKFKEYDLELRTKEEARELAFSRGKIKESKNVSGADSSRALEQTSVNIFFFKKWSPQMAWVLGLLFTDGNMSLSKPKHGKKLYYRVTLAQKDPEILHKSLKLLESNAKIYENKSSKENEERYIYYYQLSDQEVSEDLLKLGMIPKKSLTLKFPQIPDEYLRHFVRGCWDGDGSIFSMSGGYQANFISGSRDFMMVLIERLRIAGFENLDFIINHGDKNDYYEIKFRTTEKCGQLYEFLYEGVEPSMYYEKKHQKFFAAYTDWQKTIRYKEFITRITKIGKHDSTARLEEEN